VLEDIKDLVLPVHEVQKIINSFWTKNKKRFIISRSGMGIQEGDWIEELLGHFNKTDVLRDYDKANPRAYVDDLVSNL
jgi:hypothetical protein